MRYEGKDLALKILDRDYERWIQYMDECIKDRSAFTKSFYAWKKIKGLKDKDAEDLAEIMATREGRK